MIVCARALWLALGLIGAARVDVLPDQSPGRAIEQPPVLTTFAINGGATSVSAADSAITLGHTVVGARPTEYRASRRADFLGARWLPYTAAPIAHDWYDGNGESCDATRPSHRVTYYLQVRAPVGEEVKTADGQRRLVPAHVESNVLRATICAYLTPPTRGSPEPAS